MPPLSSSQNCSAESGTCTLFIARHHNGDKLLTPVSKVTNHHCCFYYPRKCTYEVTMYHFLLTNNHFPCLYILMLLAIGFTEELSSHVSLWSDAYQRQPFDTTRRSNRENKGIIHPHISLLFHLYWSILVDFWLLIIGVVSTHTDLETKVKNETGKHNSSGYVVMCINKILGC